MMEWLDDIARAVGYFFLICWVLSIAYTGWMFLFGEEEDNYWH